MSRLKRIHALQLGGGLELEPPERCSLAEGCRPVPDLEAAKRFLQTYVQNELVIGRFRGYLSTHGLAGHGHRMHDRGETDVIDLMAGELANGHLRIKPTFDPRWNGYDKLIQQEVDGYNKRLKGFAGYADLYWRLVKAMVWTEVMAGPKDPHWAADPMQIGNPLDPGLKVLRTGAEHSDLITTPELRKALAGKLTGELSIKGGIAWLVTKAMKTKLVTRYEPALRNYSVRDGDTLGAIARREGTTVESLAKTNRLDPNAILKKGTQLGYQKGSAAWSIDGWQPWWPDAVRAYNGAGDSQYLVKVQKRLQEIEQRDAAQ
jgi:hypothetical protein